MKKNITVLLLICASNSYATASATQEIQEPLIEEQTIKKEAKELTTAELLLLAKEVRQRRKEGRLELEDLIIDLQTSNKRIEKNETMTGMVSPSQASVIEGNKAGLTITGAIIAALASWFCYKN